MIVRAGFEIQEGTYAFEEMHLENLPWEPTLLRSWSGSSASTLSASRTTAASSAGTPLEAPARHRSFRRVRQQQQEERCL